MSRDRRRREPPGIKGSPHWMTTYADMMSLILVFFVMLFTFSSLDVQRFQTMLQAIQGSLGVLDGGRSLAPEAVIAGGPLAASALQAQLERELQEASRMAVQIRTQLAQLGLAQQVEVRVEERGVVVRFTDQVLFDLGKADLKPEALGILHALAPVLRRWPHQFRVEGHTDDWPINTPVFPSNWELSTARASRVIRYLIEREDFAPDRLSAAGYGEYRPLFPNDTAEHRQRNRRVDVLLLRAGLSTGEPREGGQPEAGAGAARQEGGA
ncbi:flagellar motor protein MotB [Limnochorda pilosa]|uniref:Flagellar motor protein MotB n=1 Tax=Limnochorda pilosa TaxID=1555112 RepID=A0A0K2SK65_LIMPI|nr:flagellar motor protein MotB [Limnochorda pilosa]BAS27508.1 flagellar motor protein MotB [Limnochorda pilosa]